MKRVVSLVAALALAVGAFAPAAFASDAGYGQTDLIPLEDLDQETFDTYLAKFYSQDYPTYGVLDLIRDTFQGGLSNASGVNDSVWSWALNLVDNSGDIGTEIGLWIQGVKIDPNTGKVIYPDDYLTDYAKHQLDTQLKTTPPSGSVIIGSGQWLELGSSQLGYYWANSAKQVYGPYSLWTNGATAYVTSFPNGNSVICSYVDGTVVYLGYYVGDRARQSNTCHINSGFGGLGGSTAVIFPQSSSFTDWGYPSGWTYQQIIADFWGHTPQSSSEPFWNDSGYYSDHQNSFSINLPSLPSTNWGNLSKYYYNTYGDEIVEGDIDRYYYNIANNYAPYEVSYELPYWLINGSTGILDFDYFLELPTAELSTLPSDFDGGSNFWDNSFIMLSGFGSFIVLGLSFALVGLFFKD